MPRWAVSSSATLEKEAVLNPKTSSEHLNAESFGHNKLRFYAMETI